MKTIMVTLFFVLVQVFAFAQECPPPAGACSEEFNCTAVDIGRCTYDTKGTRYCCLRDEPVSSICNPGETDVILTCRSNTAGRTPGFVPTTLEPFCDRGFRRNVDGWLENLSNEPNASNSFFVPNCISSWSDIQSALNDPTITYLLFEQGDYRHLGTLELPDPGNLRRVIRPYYGTQLVDCAGLCTSSNGATPCLNFNSSCNGGSPPNCHFTDFDETHPANMDDRCRVFIRRINIDNARNWTIGFITLGGCPDDPEQLGLRIAADRTQFIEGANANVVHACLFQHTRLGLRIQDGSDNVVQDCVFRDGVTVPGGDSGGLLITSTSHSSNNVIVGNEFINMNNGIGLGLSCREIVNSELDQSCDINSCNNPGEILDPLEYPGLADISGTVIVNNDIYFDQTTYQVCQSPFRCQGFCSNNSGNQDAYCYCVADSETGIDIKSGSCDPARPVAIIGNRIRGYRPFSPNAGTGGAGAAVLVHLNARNILIEENILIDNGLGVNVESTGDFAQCDNETNTLKCCTDISTENISIINNLITCNRTNMDVGAMPNPEFGSVAFGIGIRGGACDKMYIMYNTFKNIDRALSLQRDRTYHLQCNTFLDVNTRHWPNSTCPPNGGYHFNIKCNGDNCDWKEQMGSAEANSYYNLNAWNIASTCILENISGGQNQTCLNNLTSLTEQQANLADYIQGFAQHTDGGNITLFNTVPSACHPGPILAQIGDGCDDCDQVDANGSYEVEYPGFFFSVTHLRNQDNCDDSHLLQLSVPTIATDCNDDWDDSVFACDGTEENDVIYVGAQSSLTVGECITSFSPGETPESMQHKGSNDAKAQLLPKIFPNPSNNQVHIQMEGFLEQQSMIYLKDINGKLLYTYHPDVGSSLYTINMADQPAGIYFITVEANGVRYPTQKVVIIK